MDISSRERNQLMRAIHDARDRFPGVMLHPEAFSQISNLEEKLMKLKSMNLINLRFADGAIYSLSLTDPGLVYFETRSDERWRFIRRSILVPIAVSIVTTAVIWFIKYLVTGTWI